MASRRWNEIKYSRVPSICMNNNAGHFFACDHDSFEKYLFRVESGKGSINGAAMLPRELVAQIIALHNTGVSAGRKKGKILTTPVVVEARKALAETKVRVIEAQWKTGYSG